MLAPWMSRPLGDRFDLTVRSGFAWGASTLVEARSTAALRLAGDLRVHLAAEASTRSDDRDRARLGGLGLGLGTEALGLAVHRSDAWAWFDALQTRSREREIRAWADPGVELSVTYRRIDVVRSGAAGRDTTFVVAGLPFLSARRAAFTHASDRTEIEAGFGWPLGAWSVEGHVGAGSGDGDASRRWWGWGSVRAPASDRIRIVLEAGRNSGLPMVGREPAGFVRAGIELELTPRLSLPPGRGPFPGRLPSDEAAPGPTPRDGAAADVALRNGVPHLVVRARSARAVAVKGDFTAWDVRDMVADGRGVWVFPVEPGVHRLNIRIDAGEWTVPSGLPALPDEFTGAPVAVLTVDPSALAEAR